MRYMRIASLLLVSIGTWAVAIAASALGASTNNPRWWLCVASEKGKFAAGCEKAGTTFEQMVLGEGESHESKASATGTQELQLPSATILMKKLKFVAGATVKGSKLPNAGTGEQTIEFEEVSVKGAPECKIEQSKKVVTVLKTNSLKDKLAFQTHTAAEKEAGPMVLVLEPASGKTFIELELVGATCPATGTMVVEGSLVLEDLEPEKYKETHELRGPATPITAYYVNEAGKTVEKTGELKSGATKVPFLVIAGLALVGVAIFASVAR